MNGLDGLGPTRRGLSPAFLAYVVPQNRALATQLHKHAFTRQEIHLPIPDELCVPLRGSVTSRAAREIVGDAEPFSFWVSRVPFTFSEEVQARMVQPVVSSKP